MAWEPAAVARLAEATGAAEARARELKAAAAKLAERFAALTQWLAVSEYAHAARQAAADVLIEVGTVQ